MTSRPWAAGLGVALLPLFSAACTDDGTGPGGGNDSPGDISGYEPERVLVRFAPEVDAEERAEDLGATPRQHIGLDIWLLEVPAGQEEDWARDLEGAEEVLFAEPNRVRTLGLNADPCSECATAEPAIGLKWDLWNTGEVRSRDDEVLAETGAEGAHLNWLPVFETLGAGYGGHAVVGVIDTGIRASHQDLQGRVAGGANFHEPGKGHGDDHGHGTHVAGIIAAGAESDTGMTGVAYFPGIRLLAAKACGELVFQGVATGYGCTSSSVVEGILWATEQGAHVLALGMGGTEHSQAEQEALRYALESGVLPVCAVGDDETRPHHPARNPECLAVSATDWGDELADYSNRGEAVELSAPGGDFQTPDGYSAILSTLGESDEAYGFMAGTAMASAQVAGAAAFVRSAGITGPQSIRDRLAEAAEAVDGDDRSPEYGYGRVDLARTFEGLPVGSPSVRIHRPSGGATFAPGEEVRFEGEASHPQEGDLSGAIRWHSSEDGEVGRGPRVSTTLSTGTHLVTASVRDSGGRADSATVGLTVEEPEDEDDGEDDDGDHDGDHDDAPIQLDVEAERDRGLHKAHLTWSGAASSHVAVFRDGEQVATRPNDPQGENTWTDDIDERGSGTYTYRVCEAEADGEPDEVCSDEVTIHF